MRRSHFRASDLHAASVSIAAMNNLFHPEARPMPALKRIAPEDPLEGLTLMQQLGLLQMLSAHARGVMRHISAFEAAQDTPSHADYRALADMGLCIRPEGEPYHELTDEGRTRAQAVFKALCRQYDLHLMLDEFADGYSTFRCSCGGWLKSYQGRGQFVWRRACNEFYAHSGSGKAKRA